MTIAESLEVSALYSISQHGYDLQQWQKRPYRSPHHTASSVALVGGGAQANPGEISLAHHGVLFLDELPEFPRQVLEVLREPLESGEIHISRAAKQTTYPAQFQLIAAMNPCPCGWLGDPEKNCRCTAEQVQRYRNRISGPLLDRIDMHIELPRMSGNELLDIQQPTPESSASIAQRVIAARDIQQARQNMPNAHLGGSALEQHLNCSDAARTLLTRAVDKLSLTGRAAHRILKLARTIADLTTATAIETHHVAEAINLRRLDRP